MLLRLEHVYKNYKQEGLDVPVLKDINLQIEEGEYVAIMGPSGSGKSTLMNIVGCLDRPTEGSYLLADEEIGRQNDKKMSMIRNKYIGFVFQNFNLLPRQTALQNVELPLQYAGVPRSKRRRLCEEALERVGLSDRIGFRPTQLSGGQKQRVAIARAMVNRPKILLADEPTGALDSRSGIQVMQLFRKLHQEGTTVVMITHAMEIARHAERIITIFDGRITGDEKNPNPSVPVLPPEEENSASEGVNASEIMGPGKTSSPEKIIVSESAGLGETPVPEEINASALTGPGETSAHEGINTSGITGPEVTGSFEKAPDTEEEPGRREVEQS